MLTGITMCPECGMQVSSGEFHPFAACLMYRSCRDPDTVRGNLRCLVPNRPPASKTSGGLYEGMQYIVPLADIQHVERYWYRTDKDRTKDNYRSIIVVTRHTTWSVEADTYANAICIPAGDEARAFLEAWVNYLGSDAGPNTV